MPVHVVCEVAELPPGGRRTVTIGNRKIAVFNVDGAYYGIFDRCPHQGGSLSSGTVVGRLDSSCPGEYVFDEDERLVKCPWHGWEFSLASGQSRVEPEHLRVRPYRVARASGQDLAPTQPGPYVAETVSVKVESDYVVIEL